MFRVLSKENQKEMVRLLEYGVNYLKNRENPSKEKIENGERIVGLGLTLLRIEADKQTRVRGAIDKLGNIEMYMEQVHEGMSCDELEAVLEDIKCVIDEVKDFIDWGEVVAELK